MHTYFIFAILMIINIASYALDVSTKIESLGNPYTNEYPDGEDIYARNIWDLQLYQGKIYLGAGNSSNDGPAQNAGPVTIYSYLPESNQFSNEGSVDDEQIDLFRVLNEQLYIPGHDPLQSWSWGNFYRLNASADWEKVRNIPDAIHVYDMAYHNNKLYAALGASSGAEIAISEDNGETWKIVSLGSSRAYSFLKINQQLFAVKKIKSKSYMEQYGYINLYTVIELNNVSATTLSDMINIPTSKDNTNFVVNEASVDSINYFLLQLSQPLSFDVSVSYRTQSMTATSPEDFTHISGIATIEAGKQHIAVPVPIKADNDTETNEDFKLILSDPVGVNFPGDIQEISQTHTIIDDKGNNGISEISAEELFPDSDFTLSQSGKILRSISLDNGKSLYIGAYTHNDHQYWPFGLFLISNNGVEKISLNSNYLIWDVLLVDNKVNILISDKISTDNYQIRVLSSSIDDLNSWNEVFNFNQATFARSFEYDNGNYYFGLGTEVDDPDNWSVSELHPSTGSLLRLKKEHY